jgi:hypothetical protein
MRLLPLGYALRLICDSVQQASSVLSQKFQAKTLPTQTNNSSFAALRMTICLYELLRHHT